MARPIHPKRIGSCFICKLHLLRTTECGLFFVMKVRIAILACLLMAGAGLTACTHVQPWERADLAHLQEQAQRCSGAQSYTAHFWMVREAAVGGSGTPGGGCGCN